MYLMEVQVYEFYEPLMAQVQQNELGHFGCEILVWYMSNSRPIGVNRRGGGRCGDKWVFEYCEHFRVPPSRHRLVICYAYLRDNPTGVRCLDPFATLKSRLSID